MRDLHILNAICTERLAAIPVPQPFDLGGFATSVAASRRRPLEIRDLPAPARGLVTGAWVATGQADIVYIEPDASAWHRDLIGLHEIGHILCDHPSDATWDYSQVAALLPDISPDTIRRMLGRHGYTSDEEREAELIATLIRARSDTGPSPHLREQDALLPRLAEALQHPLRHV